MSKAKEVKVLDYEDWSQDGLFWYENRGCTKMCHGDYEIIDKGDGTWKKGEFEHGRKIGEWFYYDKDGVLVKVYLYRNGWRISAWNRDEWLEKCIREEL